MLAHVEDIKIPGRELTDAEAERAGDLLTQVSARFRREARRQFTPGASTVRLQVLDLVIVLPEAPVVEVERVLDDDGRELAWRRLSPTGQEVALDPPGEIPLFVGSPVSMPGFEARRPRFATVTYTHGGTVPDDVRLAVADAVRRVLTLDADAAAGAASITDTRGPFSRTRQFAAWAVGGQALLSPEDLALARSYRPRSPRLWVMRP